MIKVTEQLEKLLIETNEVGHFSEFGAVIGDDQFVLYYPEGSNDVFLAHISEFEQNGFFITLKEQ